MLNMVCSMFLIFSVGLRLVCSVLMVFISVLRFFRVQYLYCIGMIIELVVVSVLSVSSDSVGGQLIRMQLYLLWIGVSVCFSCCLCLFCVISWILVVVRLMLLGSRLQFLVVCMCILVVLDLFSSRLQVEVVSLCLFMLLFMVVLFCEFRLISSMCLGVLVREVVRLMVVVVLLMLFFWLVMVMMWVMWVCFVDVCWDWLLCV